MVASKADIIARESLGFTHLVYKGNSYFVNLDSESSRLKFKSYLESETSKEWDIAKLERYVFYRKDMYGLVGNNLRLNSTFRGKVEIPINTTSCECMFFNKALEGIDFSDFDTSSVEDMEYMFYKCTFPEGFSLGKRFDTAKVRNMYCMFRDTQFTEGFSLGDKFDTSKVRNMYGMFSYAKFNKGFSLGDKFDTSNVEDMNYMFIHAKFNEGFNLGDRFDTSSVENMFGIFSGTQFNEDFRLAKDFTVCKAKSMFTDAKLPSRVVKQLSSETTDEEIVELLKST